MDIKSKIITQFIKDLSFENPQGPMSFQNKDKRPEVKVNLDVQAKNKKETNIYEIELNINVSSSIDNEKIYLIDLKYVGIFEIENLTDDIKEAYLLVECPRQLFPFARRIIYDLHADGALPPLMLDPVNFADLYQKKKQAAN
mgnify:FL=1